MLLGLLSSIIFSPILIITIPYIYESVREFIGWILIGVVVFMILKDKGNNKKFWNFYTFIISGIFGIVVFNLHEIKEPLLPMLFIVSQVELAGGSLPGAEEGVIRGLRIAIRHAEGSKCERCWNYSVQVGRDSEFPTLCERCVPVVREMQAPAGA